MTREAMKYGAVNLRRAFLILPRPKTSSASPCRRSPTTSISTHHLGREGFSGSDREKTKWYLGLDIDPETELTVTCGSTEGMISAMMATVDPGESHRVRAVLRELRADAILSDRQAALRSAARAGLEFRRAELRAAFNPKTKAIILCNPNNPTGKVFTRAEMD
jgi:aminotransferase